MTHGWLEVLAYLTAWGGLGAALAIVTAGRRGRWRRDPFLIVIGDTGSRE